MRGISSRKRVAKLFSGRLDAAAVAEGVGGQELRLQPLGLAATNNNNNNNVVVLPFICILINSKCIIMIGITII